MTEGLESERFIEIRRKINRGEAIVLTAQEMCDLVREKGTVSMDEVDVVTAATKGIMSGTLATLSIPVAEPDSFIRAKAIWLNGVPGFPGPAPNERLGIVDLVIYGTAHSRNNPTKYGGGHLFRDLVERKDIHVIVETSEGRTIERDITLDEIQYAILSGMRNCFRNYQAFINATDEPLPTIFSRKPLRGPFTEAVYVRRWWEVVHQ